MQYSPDSFLWVEKYRPQKVEDCILPARIIEYVKQLISKGEIQHLMAIGSAGIGKTSVARAICAELDSDMILINCSENGNIDTLRTTIRNFASTVSLVGGTKVVILDEADNLTAATQSALRGFIEEFSNNCRFIFTANYGNKIIEPLKSRTVQIDLSMTKEEKRDVIVRFDKRVKDILAAEGVEYDSKVLAQLVMRYFPDFRKTLNELQRLSVSGKLDATAMAAVSADVVRDIYQLLKGKKFADMRKFVAENPDIDFPVLTRMLWAAADEYVKADSIPQMLLHINQYQLNNAVVVDKEINLMAFLTELMVDLEFK